MRPGVHRKQLILLLRERLRLSVAHAIARSDDLPGLLVGGLDKVTAEEWLDELRRIGVAGKMTEAG